MARCLGNSYCDCSRCLKRRDAAVRAANGTGGSQKSRRTERSNWSPRTTGSVDDREVTFRQGEGDREGHTLISDGQKSAREFDREHNHYGPKTEGGRIEDDDGDRGHYTGSGH